MKYFYLFLLLTAAIAHAAVQIPADDPNIQYYGRWDFTDPKAPAHSWPGVYIYVEFEGTSIGVRMNDNFCYYNVIIDGGAVQVFHPTITGVASYTLRVSLTEGRHTLLFHKRNETTWTKFSFNGFILDDGKSLLPLSARPERKIEFIGDSFTSASGNEYTKPDKPADDAPLTNIYEGFGPIIARHYGAQYMMTSRSGYGMVEDWQSNRSGNLPDIYGGTHIYTAAPPWDFEQWIPNLVVIGLGLNDYSGFGGYSGTVSESNKTLYKTRYHEFIGTIRDNYPGVKILAVAPHVLWLQQTISEVVAEENSAGNLDVHYAFYPYYEGGYVFEGHPSVATHHKIADQLIAAIDQIDAWTPYVDLQPPVFVSTPKASFVSYTAQVELKFETDSYATVRYSDQDKSWDLMEHTFTTTGQRLHSVTIACEHGKQYTYYFRAADVHGNMMPASTVLSFIVDTSKVLLQWKDPGYDDSGWKTGPTPIGYGPPEGIKTVTMVANTLFFRRSVAVQDLNLIAGLGLLVKGRDGAIVYLNGHEIARINFPAGEAITYETTPAEPMSMNKMVVINASSGLAFLRSGDNTLALEMHAYDSVALGLSYDAQLIDNKNNILFRLGSEWRCFDAGWTPEEQVRDNNTRVFTPAGQRLPERAELWPNYPNPFNGRTLIRYRLPHASQVDLRIYSTDGRLVRQLADGVQTEGFHQIEWDGLDASHTCAASGIYFCRLSVVGAEGADRVQTIKLNHLR